MQHTHSSAAGLLERALQLIGTDVEAWLSLFADDAVVEFPYAPSLGRAAKLVGKAAIAAYFRPALQETFTQLQFRDLRIESGASPDVAFAQVHGSAILQPGAHMYEQDYVMFMHTKNGLAVRYVEYWNPLQLPEVYR